MGRKELLIDETMRRRIVQLRTEQGLTYGVISKRFGISPPTIKKICDMKAKP
jgi:DNA-binding CsgD family transcriptional regulator